jgi:hypothetical protein
VSRRVFRLTKQAVTEQTLRAPGGQPVQLDLLPPSNGDWELENFQVLGEWIYAVWSRPKSSPSDYPGPT